MIFAGLIGAIAWDIITWYFGLPTSSSHALVGGMAGAAVASAGLEALIASGFQKIAVFIVLSPLVGLLLGFTFMVADLLGRSTGTEGRPAEPGVPGGPARSPPRRSASATARTTHRRRWASSWPC